MAYIFCYVSQPACCLVTGILGVEQAAISVAPDIIEDLSRACIYQLAIC
jgi:hypothetical protein